MQKQSFLFLWDSTWPRVTKVYRIGIRYKSGWTSANRNLLYAKGDIFPNQTPWTFLPQTLLIHLSNITFLKWTCECGCIAIYRLHIFVLKNLHFHFSDCKANQQSLVNLIPVEDEERLPNGSSVLPVNATCQWNITAPVGKVVTVRIKLLVPHFSGSCSDEHVVIYDGPNNSSSVIAQYCNGPSSFFTFQFLSSGRSLFLETKTGHTSSRYRMRAYYRVLDFQGN